MIWQIILRPIHYGLCTFPNHPVFWVPHHFLQPGHTAYIKGANRTGSNTFCPGRTLITGSVARLDKMVWYPKKSSVWNCTVPVVFWTNYTPPYCQIQYNDFPVLQHSQQGSGAHAALCHKVCCCCYACLYRQCGQAAYQHSHHSFSMCMLQCVVRPLTAVSLVSAGSEDKQHISTANKLECACCNVLQGHGCAWCNVLLGLLLLLCPCRQ